MDKMLEHMQIFWGYTCFDKDVEQIVKKNLFK